MKNMNINSLEIRVINNGLNKEWDYLAEILSRMSVEIANEKNEENYNILSIKYNNYLTQQKTIETIQLKLNN